MFFHNAFRCMSIIAGAVFFQKNVKFFYIIFFIKVFNSFQQFLIVYGSVDTATLKQRHRNLRCFHILFHHFGIEIPVFFAGNNSASEKNSRLWQHRMPPEIPELLVSCFVLTDKRWKRYKSIFSPSNLWFNVLMTNSMLSQILFYIRNSLPCTPLSRKWVIGLKHLKSLLTFLISQDDRLDIPASPFHP